MASCHVKFGAESRNKTAEPESANIRAEKHY
jgi:hypothetical protein